MSNEKYQLRELSRAEERRFKTTREDVEDMQNQFNKQYKKPEREGGIVYSNFNHEYDMTEEEVKNSNMYHAHPAWNFCGYVWFDSEKQQFVEEIMVYKSVANIFYGGTLDEVIQKAIELYGSE